MYVFFLLFSLLFLTSFHTSLLNGQKTLFYRGLGLLGITTIIFGIIGGLGRVRAIVKVDTFIAALALSFSFHLVFFVLFPVTFDRSVTMFLLNTLNTKKYSCITQNNLETNFINTYVKEQQAIPRRVFEQKQIGFIEENGACINATSKTTSFLYFSEVIKLLYAVKK